MQKLDLMYTGKAKKVYSTDDETLCIFEYKDDATAFNGEKKGSFEGKGIINNKMANIIFRLLEKEGIRTHFVEQLSDRETLVKKVNIIPLEVIIRNVAAGSFSKRYGVKEGTALESSTIEFSYKNDDLGDPLINSYHAVALGIATRENIEEIKTLAFKINDALKKIFIEIGIKLIDFKIEVGFDSEGNIILSDEISPDTCRLWDAETNKKLDKDRFRFDLGEFGDVYHEVFNRLVEKYGE
ncbi:MAG: phosphoribosylaminoimidazolesuccinocarboxamide synthase [Firmicutes bacterium]|nr:phosphoribosylaminoimidazolesuccinocarboxamide synthase [Bacillota bacterium]